MARTEARVEASKGELEKLPHSLVPAKIQDQPAASARRCACGWHFLLAA
jgi:hypothetical protein